MSEKIIIKCPKGCGYETTVDFKEDLLKKPLRCPNCKRSSPFTEWMSVVLEKPVVPEKPVIPEKPIVPEVPVVPDEPIASDEPVVPDEPIDPEVPVASDESVAPLSPVIPVAPSSETLGRVEMLSTGAFCFLRPGKNIIGREASSSAADIQIPDVTGKRRMSREHLVIEVTTENGYTQYYAYLYKPQVATTFVNDVELQYEKKTLLKDGDVIRFYYEALRIHIPAQDEDHTFFQ